MGLKYIGNRVSLKQISVGLAVIALVALTACAPNGQSDSSVGFNNFNNDSEDEGLPGPVPESEPMVTLSDMHRLRAEYAQQYPEVLVQPDTPQDDAFEEIPIPPVPPTFSGVFDPFQTSPNHEQVAPQPQIPPSQLGDVGQEPFAVGRPAHRQAQRPSPGPAVDAFPTGKRAQLVSSAIEMRVKLYPLNTFEVKPYDPYRSNRNVTTFAFDNAQGLNVVDANSNNILFSSQKITVDLKTNQIIGKDGQKSDLSEVKITPVNISQPTQVWGMINSRTGKDGSFSYTGHFDVWQANGEDQTGGARWVITNNVLLEDYVTSVTIVEISPSLVNNPKTRNVVVAQSVAVRSYALTTAETNRKRFQLRHWDILPTTANQAYLGINEYYAPVREAIKSHFGKVIKYGGVVILAAYSSNSGGHTCSGLDCWNMRGTPYLQAKPDVPGVENRPNGKIRQEVTKMKLVQALREVIGQQAPVTPDAAIVVSQRNSSQRVQVVQVVDNGFQKVLDASQTNTLFNKIIAVGNRYIDIGSPTSSGLLIQIRGFGHGVGMSQHGAIMLSEQGRSPTEILKFYYTGASVESI